MSSRVHATLPRRMYVLIESLEPRQLLSNAYFYPSSLYIDGDQTDDRIVVQYKPDHSGALQVILNGATYDQPANTNITWMDINLSAGNDQFSFKVPDSDLTPRKFDSIARIETYLGEHAGV